MKKYCIISVLALLMAIPSWACFFGEPTHNMYLFSVIKRDAFNNYADKLELNAFWRDYTNGIVTDYEGYYDDVTQPQDEWGNYPREECRKLIRTIARQRNDSEVLAYTDQLDAYLSICDEIGHSWNYPTKEELAAREQRLNLMVTKAKAYKGQRLASQWALLQMRANMLLKKHQDNITFWKTKASKMSDSPYRKLMENIYAGALCNSGKLLEACEIYTAQGDMRSLKWAVRKMRNNAGIENIYAQDPNSPFLHYLVQDFVNNADECVNVKEGEMTEEELKQWEGDYDTRLVLRPNVLQFISFAEKVLSEGKTTTPALWQSAIGALQYLIGENAAAMASMRKAVTMEGTPRMKDNARAIQAVVSTRSGRHDHAYNEWILGEIEWLKSKAIEESGGAPLSSESDFFDVIYNNHYYDVIDRLMYHNLVPMYRQEGQPAMGAALIALLSDSKAFFGVSYPSNDTYGNSYNPNYSTEYFALLEKMAPEEVSQLGAWRKKASADRLESYLKSHIGEQMDDEYLNDIIGTKYIAAGEFAQAIPFLEQVSPRFMEGMNISYYLAHRDYTRAVWLGRQAFKKDIDTDGKNLATLSDNPKLRFCKEMVSLLNEYGIAKRERRQELAYQLAVRYYQCSEWGDCWYLSNYFHSRSFFFPWEDQEIPPLVQRTYELLGESKQSKNLETRKNSLLGQAFIPCGPWYETGEYYPDTNSWELKPLKGSRRYQYYKELNDFANANWSRLDRTVTKCDLLKEFRSTL